MMKGSSLVGSARFRKRYPSAVAADVALFRSHMARKVGVPTPAAYPMTSRLALSFERVVASDPPSLAQMVTVLQCLQRVPPEGLTRFDPFLRIHPRLGFAPPRIRSLVTALMAKDVALGWPGSSVVHGDFHPGQTMRDTAGTVWLLDLDDLALAPPEADLGNLAAWFATQAEGNLTALASHALAQLLALAPDADQALTTHFFKIALVRRALKLAERGAPWALDQLPLRT
jgi:Phosphotransferase enzyme family